MVTLRSIVNYSLFKKKCLIHLIHINSCQSFHATTGMGEVENVEKLEILTLEQPKKTYIQDL